MEPTQIVIIISLTSVTAVIVACGIWVIKLLKEFKGTIIKTNLILDDTNLILQDAKTITKSVAQPVSSFSEFVMGFKNGFKLFNNLFPNKPKKEEK